MDLQLKDKLAFVSGSTKGIGKAIAAVLLKEGAKVIINGRSKTDEVLASLKPFGDVYAIEGDLSDQKEADRICKEIDAIGDLDILINNVGAFIPVPFEDISDEEWNQLFEMNVLTTVRLSRYFFPKMMKRDFGRIINMSSEAGMRGLESMVHYSVTKGALFIISRGMANLTQGCGKNITANSVLPGPTMTEGVAQWLKDSSAVKGQHEDDFVKEFFKETEPDSLLQRFIEAEEIANVVAFIASPLSAAINGASIKAEGGIIKTIA